MMRGSTTTWTRTSLCKRSDSSREMRSRSAGVSSIAVVTVARTRPAASSAIRSKSAAMSSMSATRFDSMSSLARLVPSSPSARIDETSLIRSPASRVGLESTAATSGSVSRSRASARRPCHSSIWPSCWASSNTARAYRLAAAVATRNLLDRLLDQALLLPGVERLADHLLRRGDHHAGHLGADRLDGLFALGLDLLAGGLGQALRIRLGLLPHLLPHLLRRPVGARHDLLRRTARVLQALFRVGQPLLGLLARLLGLLELGLDRLLPRLCGLDDARVRVAGEDPHHQQEGGELDPERRVDLEQAGVDEKHR